MIFIRVTIIAMVLSLHLTRFVCSEGAIGKSSKDDVQIVSNHLYSKNFVKAFNRVASKTPKGVLMHQFLKQLEVEISPIKLNEHSGETSLGIGEFRIGSKSNPPLKLQLTTVFSTNKNGETTLVVHSAYIGLQKKHTTGKVVFQRISPIWREGEFLLERGLKPGEGTERK